MSKSALSLVLSTAAVALALTAGGFATSASANELYASQREAVNLQSALSVHNANVATTSALTAQDYGAGQPLDAPPKQQVLPASTHVASTTAVAPVDLVGNNGPQDALAREIFHPGQFLP